MKPTLHTLLLIAAALAIALLADAWRSARHDSAQLAATLSTQNAAIQQSAANEKQRDAQLTAALAAIAQQKRSVQTPQQAAAALPSVLPPLPLPISIHLPDLSPSRQPTENLPATVTIPQADLKPLYDDLQDCRANALNTDALKKDLTDQKAQSAALQHERDAAISAARGGTFWLRLKREAKWFAIGLAAGAATAAAHR